MTTVYIPRPIRTVEDAEGLPEGTIVTEGIGAWVGWDDDGTVTFTDGEDSAITPRQMIGWTALVPVEAEEEWEAEQETAAKAATKHRRTYGLLRDEDQR